MDFSERAFMLEVRYTRFFSLLISFCILIAPMPLSEMAEDLAINLSEYNINKDSHVSYIYLRKELSNINYILSEIAVLDTDTNSPLMQLNDHIKNGLLLLGHESVVNALEYA